ncbi:hypothetical protein [Nonomuraea sp. KM90]|uniref:hypothetical protein n=1 Tax=Nonomuraea sp. KM90 TaxID=3457428 RepID=UPI003FCC9DD1
MIIEDENGREWTTEELRDDYREPTEPDPEPLDLDAIDAAYEASLPEWQRGPNPVGPNTANALWAVPQLTSELRTALAELERLRANRWQEYTVTDGREPHADAELISYGEADDALADEQPVWVRDVSGSPWTRLSTEAPF